MSASVKHELHDVVAVYFLFTVSHVKEAKSSPRTFIPNGLCLQT